MKRLIYAPKAFAFIHSTSHDEIIDVSDDIVSGWVDSSDNDISHAELILRNVNRKYIERTVNGVRRRVFDWNDLITIWLQRLPGQPVQVFTGYLDSVPGWQMYPGDCRIEATCTMKRLAFQWFDPGSLFFLNMANQNGWTYNPETGSGWSTSLVDDNTSDDTDGPGNTAPPTDAGMAGFMYNFLTQVAGWDPSMIMIGELDTSLIEKATALRDSKLDQLGDDTVFAEVMRRFIGVDKTDIVADAVDGVMADGTLTPQYERTTLALKSAFKNTGIPLRFAVYAAIARSGYRSDYASGPSRGEYGYGLFAVRPDRVAGHTPGLGSPVNGIDADAPFGGGGMTVSFDEEDGTTASNGTNTLVQLTSLIGSIPKSADLFKRRFNIAMNELYPNRTLRALSITKLDACDEGESIKVLAKMNLPVEAGSQGSLRAKDNSDRYIRSVVDGERITVPETAAVTEEPISLKWDSEELLTLLTPEEEGLLPTYSSHHESLIPYLWYAKKHMGDNVALIAPEGMQPQSLYLSGEIGGTALDAGLDEPRFGFPKPESNGRNDLYTLGGGLMDLFRAFVGHEEVSSVKAIWNRQANGARYMREGVMGASDDGANMLATGAIRIVMNEAIVDPPSWVGLPTEVNTQDNVQTQTQISFQQVGQFATVAALQAQFSFGSTLGYAKSKMYEKDRALLNDVSCLDAVKQFAQGSMRNLMSLPNGRLCAYYPDYFGANRGPYWYVREVEIVNLGIQLTDGPLATHVYITGDTLAPAFTGEAIGESALITEAQSHGVVSVFDVELLNAFLVPGILTTSDAENQSRKIDFDNSKAREFLNKHGARPLKEENPLIKNHWYEFLMAWQRFVQQWAACFDTRAEFTFQPEIMAGGIIGFAEHGLQMYCKQVRHDFSYDQGFTTSATLTSPAAIYDPANPNKTAPSAVMGMVIAGSVNTVGGGG